MNLAQALKLKNRLAGELVRKQQVLQRENARRSDSVSTVNRESVWEDIINLSDELGFLKGKIANANVGIYSKLERMAELKSRISFITNLNKREGEEVSFIGREQEKLTYKWDSTINQERADALINSIQEAIDLLQDEVDAYNAVTTIS